jgi:hypothetical protein
VSAGSDPTPEQLRDWFEARRPRSGGWDALDVRELASLPAFGSSLLRRFDLVFKYGPLSNEYPTGAARDYAAALPGYIEALVAEDFLDGRARAHSAPARQADSSDVDAHVTFEVVVPLTVELLV